MEPSNAALDALLASRKDLDTQLQYFLDQTAILRKKRDAIETAINIVRSTDTDLLKTIRESQTVLNLPNAEVEVRPSRVSFFDEAAVEAEIIEFLLRSGEKTRREIHAHLTSFNFRFNEAGLDRILNTSPGIIRLGIRDKTRYDAKRSMSAAG